MSLILPPWTFANEVDNMTGTPTTSWGTTVTPGTSDAEGTAATLLSALAFDVHYLTVGFGGYFLDATAFYCVADILIDPAGGTSWRPLISDLVCGMAEDVSLANQRIWYNFPIFIKAGTSVGCRTATSHSVTATTPRVAVFALGNPSRPEMWWCGNAVETKGITASVGTSVTPGNTGALGAWTSIGTVTSGRWGAIQVGFNGTDATAATLAYHFQVGYNNVMLPGSPDFRAMVDTGERAWYDPVGPLWCDIPQGTQMQVRATCSGSAEVWAGGIAVYGVY